MFSSTENALLSLCLPLCTHPGMRACVRGCVHAGPPMQFRSRCPCLSQLLSTLSLDTWSLTEPGAHKFNYSNWPVSFPIFLLPCFPDNWIKDIHHLWLFMWMLEIGTQVVILAEQKPYQLNHLSSLPYPLFIPSLGVSPPGKPYSSPLNRAFALCCTSLRRLSLITPFPQTP